LGSGGVKRKSNQIPRLIMPFNGFFYHRSDLGLVSNIILIIEDKLEGRVLGASYVNQVVVRPTQYLLSLALEWLLLIGEFVLGGAPLCLSLSLPPPPLSHSPYPFLLSPSQEEEKYTRSVLQKKFQSVRKARRMVIELLIGEFDLATILQILQNSDF
jgi:hypothetical protein